MKSLRVAILASAVSLSGLMTQAQTVDEIINKHIESIGGKEKIANIKTLYTEYDMDFNGNNAPGVTYMINGKGYRNEIDFGGQKLIQCFTDKSGWSINPMMGQTSPEPLPEDQVKASQAQIHAGGPLFDYAAKGYKAELTGTEPVNGVDAHKIKLTVPDISEYTFFIDPSTFYILKTVVKSSAGGQEVETTMTFSDYKKDTYGFVTPGSMELSLPQGITLVIVTKKVEINKEIDPKIFEME